MRKNQAVIFGSLFLLASLIASSNAGAASIDAKFARSLVEGSGCKMSGEYLGRHFSEAMDHLMVLNPLLVLFARHHSYRRSLELRCDVSPDAKAIRFDPESQTIHMIEGTTDHPQNVASFFHEFLHFVGVEIDLEFHNNSGSETPAEILSKDAVYACHVAVFPEIASDAPGGSEGLIPIARKKCQRARIDLQPLLPPLPEWK